MSGFVMFSTAEESYPYALAELRAVCGAGFRSQRLGPDIGVVLSDVDVMAVADACAAARVVFVRHLSVERARLPLDQATAANIAAAAAAALHDATAPAAFHDAAPPATVRDTATAAERHDDASPAAFHDASPSTTVRGAASVGERHDDAPPVAFHDASASAAVRGAASVGERHAAAPRSTPRETAPASKTIALQVWSSGEVPSAPRAGEIVAAVDAALDIEVVRAGARQVLSVVATPAGVSIGLNAAVDSLADWPGGRVRLARDARQISRAEFKLEELFTVYDVDLPPDGRALDLGAAPGGWTRILRERGLDVWAVDPGDLDVRLSSDRRIHHVRTTAGEFFRARPDDFDVVVNDMRMDPRRSCQVMRDAARHLTPGGTAIVTLKTGSHKPVETVRSCLDLLASHYRVEFARQLHHNRHEVTVVARRLPRRDTR